VRRRTLLAGLGTTLATGLTGCAALGSATESTPTDTPTPPPDASRNEAGANGGSDDTGQSESRPQAVHETVVLPWTDTPTESTQPHDLRFWNAVDGRRELTVTVSPQESSTLTGVTTTHRVPAHEAVAVELRQPATYTVSVQVGGTQVTAFELAEDWFDCNASSTLVELGPDGAVDRTETSTLVACVDATVETPTDGEGTESTRT
jgi:hypothetical protein